MQIKYLHLAKLKQKLSDEAESEEVIKPSTISDKIVLIHH